MYRYVSVSKNVHAWGNNFEMCQYSKLFTIINVTTQHFTLIRLTVVIFIRIIKILFFCRFKQKLHSGNFNLYLALHITYYD